MSFDRVADLYDRTRAVPEGVLTRLGALLVERAGGGKPLVLDIGTGTGRGAVPLARAGARVVGIDVSEQMMGRLRSRLGPELDIRLLRADFEQIPFRAASFDAVLAYHALHLARDPSRALEEIRRVLIPAHPFFWIADTWAGEGFYDLLKRRYLERAGGSYGSSRPSSRDFTVLEKALPPGTRVERLADPSLTWEATSRLQEVLDRLEARGHSFLFSVPEPLHREIMQDLRRWAWGEFGERATQRVHFQLEPRAIFFSA